MKVRNISPLGALQVPALGVTIPAGQVADVPDEEASRLLNQTTNFAPVPDDDPTPEED